MQFHSRFTSFAILPLLTGSLGLALLGSTAAHADCPSSPSSWDSAPCLDLDPTAGVDLVCEPNGGVWECDVSTAGAASKVYMVTGYGGDEKVQAWGNFGTSQLFCCESTNWDGEDVRIIGSDYADTLAFEWDSGAYYVESVPSGSWSYDILTGTIRGGDGNDTIRGSLETDADYSDWLYGEADDDTMSGMSGADYMYGGTDDDTMNGGPGDDEMWGEEGNDSMQGGTDDDEMYGGDEPDMMSGGPDDDTMIGGDGGDVMCGDSGVDILVDYDSDDEGAYPDRLWDTSGSDEEYLSSSSTNRDYTSQCFGGPTCPGVEITSRPPQCP